MAHGLERVQSITQKAWHGSHHGSPGSRECDGTWPEVIYPRGPASSGSTSPSRTRLQKFSVSPNITTSRGSSVRNISDSHHSLLPGALKSSHKVHRVHFQKVPTALVVPALFKCLESRDSWQSLSCESQKSEIYTVHSTGCVANMICLIPEAEFWQNFHQ